MNLLAKELGRACAALGLRIELGYTFSLPNMPDLTAVARISDLGAANGMLIFDNYDEIRELTQQLPDAGYGFSVLSQPEPSYELDLDSFKEMFTDWGWSGEPGRKPAWMP
jgi:hypothetical protein